MMTVHCAVSLTRQATMKSQCPALNMKPEAGRGGRTASRELDHAPGLAPNNPDSLDLRERRSSART